MAKSKFWKSLTTGSNKENITLWAAVIGFVLSTANGGFTVYDKIISQPEEQQDKQYREFESDVQQLTSLMPLIQGGLDGPLQKSMAAQAQAMSVANDAMNLLPSVKKRLGTADFVVLSTFEYQIDPAASLALANDAVGVARGTYMTVETLRMRAKARAQLGDADAMRDVRNDFQTALGKADSDAMQVERILILGDWMVTEGTYGQCSGLDGIVSRWSHELVTLPMPPYVRAAYFQPGAVWLNAQNRCAWNHALLAPLLLPSAPASSTPPDK